MSKLSLWFLSIIVGKNVDTPINYYVTAKYGDIIKKVNDIEYKGEQLEEVLQTLTPREAMVLKLRFGLDDGRPRTLEEVGKKFAVTRERIRQIEAKALRKLRHPSRSKKLKDYMDV